VLEDALMRAFRNASNPAKRKLKLRRFLKPVWRQPRTVRYLSFTSAHHPPPPVTLRAGDPKERAKNATKEWLDQAISGTLPVSFISLPLLFLTRHHILAFNPYPS
jgi:hypothetical protein